VTNVIQNAIDALSLGSLFALIALGIALIFGIMNLINFAHGELILVGGYAMYLFAGDLPWPIIVIITVLTGGVFALAMERIAFRPVRGADPATLLVTSFAVSYLLQHLTILVISPQPKAVDVSSSLLAQVHIGSVEVSKLDIVTTITTLVLLVALALFLKRSTIGLQMRAAAEDFRMARFLGVRANAVIAAAFAVSGLLAGVVAVFWIGRTGNVSPTIGLAPLLAGVVAATVGGMGSLVGAVVGGYLLGILTVVLDAALPEHLRVYRDAFVFGGVLLILLVRPQGIMPGASGARV
jgi:branched-chain amino acid transport system permease protein